MLAHRQVEALNASSVDLPAEGSQHGIDGLQGAKYCSGQRSYWIPGSYAPTLSENHDSFLRLLKNKDFKEERMTKVELDAIGTSTPLESNKSLISLMGSIGGTMKKA